MSAIEASSDRHRHNGLRCSVLLMLSLLLGSGCGSGERARTDTPVAAEGSEFPVLLQEAVVLIQQLGERLPVAEAPPEIDRLTPTLFHARAPLIAHTYSYSLWRGVSGECWVLRTGGYLGGQEWLGPAEADDVVVQQLLALRAELQEQFPHQ